MSRLGRDILLDGGITGPGRTLLASVAKGWTADTTSPEQKTALLDSTGVHAEPQVSPPTKVPGDRREWRYGGAG